MIKGNWLKLFLLVIGIGLGLVVAFIEFPSETQKDLQTFKEEIGKEVNDLEVQVSLLENQLLSQRSESLDASAPPVPQVSATPTQALLTSKTAIAARQNAELFREMFQVVFIREPKDRAEFGDWVDTLNQGASLEGVYNGLIYNSQYHNLELTDRGASAKALRVFGEELALLEKELPQSTKFVRYAGSHMPIAEVDNAPTGAPTEAPKEIFENLNHAEQYSKLFVSSSVFTLKRVLGEEALKVFTAKNDFIEKVALWYAPWVIHMTQRGVDFGVPLRNKPDESLHYKWATTNSEDRIKWEVLNRVHRLLNEMNKQRP